MTARSSGRRVSENTLQPSGSAGSERQNGDLLVLKRVAVSWCQSRNSYLKAPKSRKP